MDMGKSVPALLLFDFFQITHGNPIVISIHRFFGTD